MPGGPGLLRTSSICLKQAASQLTGTHDFAAFGTWPRTHGTTVRTVFRGRMARRMASILQFEITANAFLYHMVRRMVYLQVAVGQARVNPRICPKACSHWRTVSW